MISAVHEDEKEHGSARYTLTETEHGHVWGVCAEVEGLFGESPRATYELFGWVPEESGVPAWVGSRVWLVPDDETLDAWHLEDAESMGPLPGTDSLLLTGLADYEGPPEGHRGSVRVHDGHRWLGSCREFTRILSPEQVPPPIVLRGFARSDQLRAALMKGTRRALDLEEAALEIRDDRGGLLTDRLLWATVSDWRPSSRGTDLIDLELDGGRFTPVPAYARPIWERWLAGPPDAVNAWAGLDTRRRGAWHDLVRERACRRSHHDRPAGHAYELDGRHITDEPALYLALGEAVNGPGGYFGGCLAALDDCLHGAFGYTAPATLLWRDAATAREHLSYALTPDGRPYDLFAAVLEALAEGGMDVTLA
ncbi:barstar family protein [Streptomyces sp. APSN-46.1]|uniref:barstar family protein n=1 Tax=Streptomyces sp. APSN-46.1 TaxID=2929049 RepID=UPI001FB54FF8|nr:barstar family protein [Streptomyces sp. APSN-46.1]MCJ1679572.1 barstar family protein [Streptomyces sp. APSN-46.1]